MKLTMSQYYEKREEYLKQIKDILVNMLKDNTKIFCYDLKKSLNKELISICDSTIEFINDSNIEYTSVNPFDCNGYFTKKS